MNISGRIILQVLLIAMMNLSFLNAQTTWRWLNGSVQSNPLDAVQALDSNIVIAVGAVATIVRTTDGGNNWTPQYHVGGSDNYLSDVVFSDSKRGIAVGQNGTVLLTTNAGESWFPQSSGTQSFLSALAYLGNQKWIAAADAGKFFRSTNDGITWNSIIPGCTYSFNALHFVTSDIGVAVGTSGGILRTTDGGLTWQDKSVSTIYSLRGAFFFNPDTGFVWGDIGVFFRTTNGGTTWMSRSYIPAFWKVTFVNSQIGYATGAISSNSLYKTTDSGESWNRVSSENVLAVSFANEEKGFCVGGDGTIIRTQDSGKKLAKLFESDSKFLLP